MSSIRLVAFASLIGTTIEWYDFFLYGTAAALVLVWLALAAALALAHAPMYGPQAAFLCELFGTRVRYSGASLGSQLSTVVAGGLSPFIATALMPYGQIALASYLVGMALITIAAVLLVPETRHHDLGG